MKKLSIILALMLAMTAFTGCEKEDDKGSKKEETKTEQKQDTKKKDKKKEKEKEVAPEEIVEAFLDDAFSQNLGDFEDYFTEDADEDTFDTFKNPDFGADFEEMTEMFGEETSDELVNAIFGACEYTIEDVEIDGDEATVTVTIEMPDFENMEIDEEEMMAEVMGIDFATATEDDLLEWLEDNGLDENCSEEELFAAISDDMIKYIKGVIKDTDKTEEEGVFNLEKNADGEWRIASMD